MHTNIKSHFCVIHIFKLENETDFLLKNNMVNYTLHYFNGRGRAEISRLIFAAAGVEFTDHRVGEDWPKAKAGSYAQVLQ